MEKILVTTDNDYFNSSDPARFFVKKGVVKELPSKLTPIIEGALADGLLREATKEEIELQKAKDIEEQEARNKFL